MSNQNDTTDTTNEEKNPLKEYARHTSVEGLHKVLSGGSVVRRLAWIAVLLICIVVACYSLRNNFIKLVDPPTSTTISTSTMTTSFPTVTVCNLNIFSAAKAHSFDLPYAISELREIFTAALAGDIQTCYRLLKNFTDLDDFSFRDLIKVLPQDLISKCRFGGEECDIDSDFVPTLTHFGVCFTFNSGKDGRPIRKVNNAGVRNGLQLQLKVNQSDYIATYAGDAGIKIAVHPQSEPPLPDDFGIAIPPGNNAFISFMKRTIEDETGMDCTEEHNADWNLLKRDYNYSQAACLADSFYTRIADVFFLISISIPPCLHTVSNPCATIHTYAVILSNTQLPSRHHVFQLVRLMNTLLPQQATHSSLPLILTTLILVSVMRTQHQLISSFKH